MELAEQLEYEASRTAHDVVTHLRCRNLEPIQPILQRLGLAGMNSVLFRAFLELGNLRNTPNLDVIFKARLREEQMKLCEIRGKVITFYREWLQIDREHEGAEKEEELLRFFKGEPAPYKPWGNDESVLVRLDTG